MCKSNNIFGLLENLRQSEKYMNHSYGFKKFWFFFFSSLLGFENQLRLCEETAGCGVDLGFPVLGGGGGGAVVSGCTLIYCRDQYIRAVF
jgi:hypothetical protein